MELEPSSAEGCEGVELEPSSAEGCEGAPLLAGGARNAAEQTMAQKRSAGSFPGQRSTLCGRCAH